MLAVTDFPHLDPESACPLYQQPSGQHRLPEHLCKMIVAEVALTLVGAHRRADHIMGIIGTDYDLTGR